jgi:hypothetical protein
MIEENRMLRTTLAATALCLTVGCTYSSVSATPILLPDGTEGYRYTGRANFGYQLDEADRVMAETCSAKGKRAQIIDQGTRNIGAGALVSNNSVMLGANQQQDIVFRCV